MTELRLILCILFIYGFIVVYIIGYFHGKKDGFELEDLYKNITDDFFKERDYIRKRFPQEYDTCINELYDQFWKKMKEQLNENK